MKFSRKMAAVTASAAMLLSACSGSGTPAPAASGGGGGTAAGCTVGVSWNNYQEERWAKWDEPAIKAALEAGGGPVHLDRRRVVGRDSSRPTSRT